MGWVVVLRSGSLAAYPALFSMPIERKESPVSIVHSTKEPSGALRVPLTAHLFRQSQCFSLSCGRGVVAPTRRPAGRTPNRHCERLVRAKVPMAWEMRSRRLVICACRVTGREGRCNPSEPAGRAGPARGHWASGGGVESFPKTEQVGLAGSLGTKWVSAVSNKTQQERTVPVAVPRYRSRTRRPGSLRSSMARCGGSLRR